VFDPIKEWGILGSTAQQFVPGDVTKALNAYDKGAMWLFISYAVAFWVTFASFIVGFFAICSRVGSCLTAIVALVSVLQHPQDILLTNSGCHSVYRSLRHHCHRYVLDPRRSD
jgi:hypothetical protein